MKSIYVTNHIRYSLCQGILLKKQYELEKQISFNFTCNITYYYIILRGVLITIVLTEISTVWNKMIYI
jgi:hypothetical protein